MIDRHMVAGYAAAKAVGLLTHIALSINSPLQRQVCMLKPGYVVSWWQQVLQHLQRSRHQAVQVALPRHQKLHAVCKSSC